MVGPGRAVDRGAPCRAGTPSCARRAPASVVRSPATRRGSVAARVERVRLLHAGRRVSALVRAWDRFWFKPQSTSTLALVRIAFGALCTLWTLNLLRDVDAFFGARGFAEGNRAAWFVV